MRKHIEHAWTRSALAACALGCCLAGAAQATDQPPQCREKRLNGLFVFSATGYTIVSGAALPKAIVELIRFNGDGTLSVPGATRSINGVIGQIPPGGTGTYTLNADCRGTVAFTAGPSFDIFAAPGGGNLWMIQTNPDNVLEGNARRVSD